VSCVTVIFSVQWGFSSFVRFRKFFSASGGEEVSCVTDIFFTASGGEEVSCVTDIFSLQTVEKK
jgi:hypothetical protein